MSGVQKSAGRGLREDEIGGSAEIALPAVGDAQRRSATGEAQRYLLSMAEEAEARGRR